MYCPECGTQLPTDATYCTECGTEIQTHTTEEKTQSAPATDDTAPRSNTTAQPQSSPPNQTTPGIVQSWSSSRLIAGIGGSLAAVSLFLPWVSAIRGGFSANGMATQFSPILIGGIALTLIVVATTWGRGWGRLGMLLTAAAGVTIAGTGLLIQSYVSKTYTLATIKINGRKLPAAALEPATGTQLAIIAGAVITLAALGGLLGSFTSS